MLVRRLGVPMLLLLLCCTGCRLAGRLAVADGGSERVKDDLSAAKRAQLRTDLETLLSNSEQRVGAVTDMIVTSGTDPAVRRAALTWKVAILGDQREENAVKRPLEMALDTWALWARVEQYLSSGGGKELFATYQPQAVAVARDIRDQSEALVSRYVPPNEFPDLPGQVQTYVEAHPIEGLFVHENVPDFAVSTESRNVMTQVLQAPWLAVTGVGDALDPTSTLARSVDRFTDEFAAYPPRLRWQAELLLLEIEQLQSVQAAIESAERISTAAERLAETGRSLPAEVRQEVETLLAAIDQRQPQLEALLQQAQDAVNDARGTLQEAGKLSAHGERLLSEAQATAAAWETTSHAVQAAVVQMQQFGKRDPDAPPAPPRRPFDIIDYKDTAESIQSATQDLSVALGQIQTLLRGEDLAAGKPHFLATTDAVLGDTETRIAGLIDQAFWRLLILVGVIFAGVVVLRFTAPRAPTA